MRSLYQCLVCGYGQMAHPPADYNICPCCGVEFAVDDVFDSHEDLRNAWLKQGAKWFSRSENHRQPINWNAWNQLDLAGFSYSIPRPKDISVANECFQVGLTLLKPIFKREAITVSYA